MIERKKVKRGETLRRGGVSRMGKKDIREKKKIRLDSVLQRNYILFTARHHVIMCVGTSERHPE